MYRMIFCFENSKKTLEEPPLNFDLILKNKVRALEGKLKDYKKLCLPIPKNAEAYVASLRSCNELTLSDEELKLVTSAKDKKETIIRILAQKRVG